MGVWQGWRGNGLQVAQGRAAKKTGTLRIRSNLKNRGSTNTGTKNQASVGRLVALTAGRRNAAV